MSKDKELMLIVDDESSIRELLSMQAESIGFQYLEATNGQEALDQIESNKEIDVVLSDLTMPVMDGITLLEKAREANFQLPFIFLTGNGSFDIKQRALRLGCFDFLDKPFEISHLSSLLKQAMEESHKIRASLESEPDQEQLDLLEVDEEFCTSVPAEKLTSIKLNKPFTKRIFNQAKQQKLIEEAIHELTFSRASLAGIEDEEKNNIELGYLFRVTRNIADEAEKLGLFEVGSLAYELAEIFMNFRVNPGFITAESTEKIKVAHEALIHTFESLDEQKGQLFELLDLRNFFAKKNRELHSSIQK